MAEIFEQLNDLHTRLEVLRMQQGIERTWRLEGMNPVVPDQFERLYAGLDDLREDRGEYAEVQALAQLHDRLDEMQQARQQERGQEQGMEY